LHEVELAAELPLLDGAEFDSVSAKQERLSSYFNQVRRGFSGKKPRFHWQNWPATCAKKPTG
jgi:hypothetical protein